MIDTKELRIGNLVTTDGLVSIVLEVRDNGAYLSVKEAQYGAFRHMHSNDIMPIPLTPEWLRKLGFTTLDAEVDIEVWGLDDNSNGEEFSIISDGLDTPMPLFFAYDLGYREIKKEIQFVHQLQNLYFALTGEELTVKQ